ncbi:hypothetical protein A5647_17325 [Mycobacterium sp. 1100029.7]|nr:hypothetical protein A5647_17325 [Mycobacterium sp. 1100029.7]
MKSTRAEKALDAMTVAVGLIQVLLVPTRFAAAWQAVAAADGQPRPDPERRAQPQARVRQPVSGFPARPVQEPAPTATSSGYSHVA